MQKVDFSKFLSVGDFIIVNVSGTNEIRQISSISSDGLTITVDEISDSVPGCTDASACNFDADATEDDGSCTYAAENYDCAGNCVADVDCNGYCGGSAVVDECNVCDGDG